MICLTRCVLLGYFLDMFFETLVSHIPACHLAAYPTKCPQSLEFTQSRPNKLVAQEVWVLKCALAWVVMLLHVQTPVIVYWKLGLCYLTIAPF